MSIYNIAKRKNDKNLLVKHWFIKLNYSNKSQDKKINQMKNKKDNKFLKVENRE